MPAAGKCAEAGLFRWIGWEPHSPKT